MEKAHWLFVKGTGVRLTSRLTGKNTSSFQHYIRTRIGENILQNTIILTFQHNHLFPNVLTSTVVWGITLLWSSFPWPCYTPAGLRYAGPQQVMSMLVHNSPGFHSYTTPLCRRLELKQPLVLQPLSAVLS